MEAVTDSNENKWESSDVRLGRSDATDADEDRSKWLSLERDTASEWGQADHWAQTTKADVDTVPPWSEAGHPLPPGGTGHPQRSTQRSMAPNNHLDEANRLEATLDHTMYTLAGGAKLTTCPHQFGATHTRSAKARARRRCKSTENGSTRDRTCLGDSMSLMEKYCAATAR